MNQLEQLKSILQKEVEDLKTNLLKNHSQQGDATNRLLSRLADRNDVIRIITTNTSILLVSFVIDWIGLLTDASLVTSNSTIFSGNFSLSDLRFKNPSLLGISHSSIRKEIVLCQC